MKQSVLKYLFLITKRNTHVHACSLSLELFEPFFSEN